jgi:RsiW-degrading membrane proteinase PrsW (M82 family)
MMFTRLRTVKPILLLILGLMLLLAAFFPIKENAPAPAGVYVVAGMMIIGAIIWMLSAKTKYRVGLCSAAGEVHAFTSPNRAYVEQIVSSVNEAMVRHQ